MVRAALWKSSQQLITGISVHRPEHKVPLYVEDWRGVQTPNTRYVLGLQDNNVVGDGNSVKIWKHSLPDPNEPPLAPALAHWHEEPPLWKQLFGQRQAASMIGRISKTWLDDRYLVRTWVRGNGNGFTGQEHGCEGDDAELHFVVWVGGA
ncbi:hypothetical protein PRZ48_008604 [Zasmidium cellare]|uniref:Uncharacterized protein n=1 Tax=Zasmidium cellare TaxID=395010 RepID=A0ABR0EH04_ZASCE|nr:hypothetical protein PRZ48_008604 [Zasmidium cellare]